MKILLINSNRLKEPYPVMPIGLCSIAAVLENAGHEVKIADLCFINNTEKEIRENIDSFKPSIIGISIRNIDTSSGFKSYFQIPEIKENVTDHCRKYFKGPIVIGGSAVGINPEEILEYLDLEYAIIGDGEFAFLEFAERINNNRTLSGLKGLIWRKNSKIKERNEPYYLNDLNRLPFAKPYKYLNLKKYRTYNTPIQIQTKRGCPLNCSYCTYNNIEGKFYRFKDPEKTAEEMADLVKHSKIKNIEIVDSIFNLPIDHAKNVLREIVKKKIKLNMLNMVINPKDIDEEFVDLLVKARVTDFGVGVESCNDEVLKKLGKNFNKEDILNASKIFKRKKLESVQWFLILGAEGETYQTIKETFDCMGKAASLWDVVFLGIGLRVYKGSPIAKKLSKEKTDIKDKTFFMPYGYNPEKIDLKTIKILSVIAFFKNHNFFMYDERVHLPLFFRYFLKIVFPKFPLWKTFIFTKFLLKITGISLLIAIILELIFNKQLKKYKNSV